MPVTIEFQGELVQCAVASDEDVPYRPVPASTRGKVTEFSAKSRKRLLELFARLNWHRQEARFMTLTYGAEYPDVETAKANMRAMLKRVWRQFGNCSVVWRLEFQERGAPHFHLFLFNGRYMPRQMLLSWWHEITGDDSITQLDIRRILSSKMARRYVSKYMAKVPVSTSLDTLPYLADDFYMGRVWGIEMRDLLLFAELITMVMQDYPLFWDIKRAARHIWPGVNKHAWSGFTLFTDNAYEWCRYMAVLSLT